MNAPVLLNNSARANGIILGRLCGRWLRKRLAAVRALQKTKRITEAEKNARARDFAEILKKVAPAWLEEAAGWAAGAQVRAVDILYLNCLPDGLYQPGGSNCTSFVRVGKRENWLFKIRDHRNHVQQFGIRQNGRSPRMQYGSDIGNLGVAHAFNSAAVAGANNTGSRTALVGDEVGLNDCHVLRYLAERARSVGEIPGLFARLLETRHVGGAGKGRGMILLFADPERGLVIESAGNNFSARFIEKGLHVFSNHFTLPEAQQWEAAGPDSNTLMRKSRMEELLKKAGRVLAPLDVFAVARDRRHVPHSLCNDDRDHFWMTVSAQLAVINRSRPDESVSFTCCGNPRHCAFVPVPLACKRCDPRALSGDYYARADALYRREHCSGKMIKALERFELDALRGGHADFWQEAYLILRAREKH